MNDAPSTVMHPEPLPGIFLWGAKRSGKSGFAGSLYALGRARDGGARWTTHPKDALDQHSASQLDQAYLGLMQRDHPATNPRLPSPLRFVARRMRGDRELEQIELSLLDPAGEYVEFEEHRGSSDGREIHRRAARSLGLIWLIEPAATSGRRVESQAEILPQLVALLEGSGGTQIRIPIAICLSKIDTLEPEARRSALEDPRAALRASLGEVVPRWFEALCPVHRYFAISSAGLTPGEVEPINVTSVLDWVVGEGRRMRQPPLVTPERIAAVRARAMPLLGRAVVVAMGGYLLLAGTSAWRAARADGAPTDTTAPIVADSPRVEERGGSIAPAEPPTNDESDRVRTVERLYDRALEAARERRWRDVVDALGGEQLPDGSRLRRSWDSLLATGAFNDSRRVAGAARRRLADLAREKAGAAIDAGPAGSRELVPLRYIRARLCEQAGPTVCERSQVISDYSWVRALGTPAQRAEAKRALDKLLPAEEGR